MKSEKQRIASGLVRPVLCVTCALILVAALGGWGAYQDWKNIRQTVLTNEITRIRSHATRTANGIERQFSKPDGPSDLQEAALMPWLREHWAKFIPPPDSIHGAVVDPNGIILSHSDPAQEGKSLCADWNSFPYPEAGPNIFSTNCASLTGGPWTLDIVVPINVEGEFLGTYHAGASQEWIENQIRSARHRSGLAWGGVIGGIMAVLLLSSVSLHNITRRSALLEAALRQSQSRRLAELHHLIIGMAHEIRNPLNAVRLNLFTADRVFRGEATLDDEEVATMLGECVREIERVDGLMTLLLGYARTDKIDVIDVDVFDEIRSVVQLLMPSFHSRDVKLQLNLPKSGGCMTRAGRGEVRQVLLNLLNNAAEAVSDVEGVIQLCLKKTEDCISVTVTDNGSGIPSENKSRLFSPFFTTKENGTGLGLPLVRSLAERAGGNVDCVCSEPGNCSFQVQWPALAGETVHNLVGS